MNNISRLATFLLNDGSRVESLEEEGKYLLVSSIYFTACAFFAIIGEKVCSSFFETLARTEKGMDLYSFMGVHPSGNAKHLFL